MGLFDIFKRRSKKAKEQKEQEVEKSKSSVNAEPKSQQTDVNITSDADQSSASTEGSSENNVSSSNLIDSGSDQSNSVKSVVDDVNKSITSDQNSDVHDSSSASNYSSVNDDNNSDNTNEEHISSISDSSSASSSIDEATISNVESSATSQDKNSDSAVEDSSIPDSKSQSSVNATSDKDKSLNDTSASSESNEIQAVESEKLNEESNEGSNEDEDEADADTEKFEHGLAKSRSSFGQKLNALFANFRSVDDDFFDDLEDTLIESDVGFDMAIKLTDQLREEVKLKNVKKAKEVQNVVIQKLIELYDQDGNSDVKIHFADKGPTVILFVGVNGVGKTTTIGKMANQYHQEGKKVLLAAADTFRAGAIQQLDVWAKRAHVDIVKKEAGSDPAAVVYEAVHKAKDENYDILFVDTAGRLQNKVNLMNELAKMKKVITREIPDAPHEILLVLDATTGQNALSQAKLFKETTDVTGIVLTKLDGSARGGIILAIRSELHIPVKLVGLGEKINDLRPFNANDYVYGLFKGLID